MISRSPESGAELKPSPAGRGVGGEGTSKRGLFIAASVGGANVPGNWLFGAADILSDSPSRHIPAMAMAAKQRVAGHVLECVNTRMSTPYIAELGCK
ncbi:hypothetical protein CAI18_14310 [Xanthomonas citri pv. punicae]|nr:hypothetical protein CAI14_06865 [Xanthomonas citri pv. punicae]QCZ68111.1 hypothetical protein CAI17_04510 [Xanthomonas citri pv. punicae]QCZ74677.1 hypothetical protein CAB38_20395 [Xanthomonas citri pv. punicae]QCZ77450.1 hypothetical protein XapA_12280 [Xanthomonas citri pv. punicae]QCZ82096.1 hypothetical protein XapB_15770 [Xanthomonas citri pv. punicae]